MISGYPDGRFRPDDPVSREAFSALLARALKLPAARGASASPFADLPADRCGRTPTPAPCWTGASWTWLITRATRAGAAVMLRRL